MNVADHVTIVMIIVTDAIIITIATSGTIAIIGNFIFAITYSLSEKSRGQPSGHGRDYATQVLSWEIILF